MLSIGLPLLAASLLGAGAAFVWKRGKGGKTTPQNPDLQPHSAIREDPEEVKLWLRERMRPASRTASLLWMVNDDLD
jgi:hypothetical protein